MSRTDDVHYVHITYTLNNFLGVRGEMGRKGVTYTSRTHLCVRRMGKLSLNCVYREEMMRNGR